jgi:hypothetical protein
MSNTFALRCLALWACCNCSTVHSCADIDSSFEPTGKITFSSDESYRANAGIAYLASMLGVQYERASKDPRTQSLRVRIDRATQRIQIIHQLETGNESSKFEHDVTCIGDEWRYSDTGKTSAEGIFREYEYKFHLKILPEGKLEVQEELHLVRGLIFKSQESYSTTARFDVFLTPR